MPDEKTVREPRIWVGKQVDTTFWAWDEFTWLPLAVDAPLNCGDIFVPGSGPEPTVDVRSMASLKTCSVIDWEPGQVGKGSDPTQGSG